MLAQSNGIEKLKYIMTRLRDRETGCPWDIEQSMQSLIKHTLEEAYEVSDAIYRDDPEHICEELGDLLFQIIFYAQIAAEKGQFTFDDVAHSICDKLIRRHPHVFDDNAKNMTAEEVNAQWRAIKAAEKSTKQPRVAQISVFDQLSSGKPSIMRANDLQKACASVGFDWDDVGPVLDKVREEVAELEVELQDSGLNKDKQEEEFGDLMFAMINLGRHLNIDPDTALQKANLKFERRFKQVEKRASEQNTELREMSLHAMEALWQAVKQAEVKLGKK